MNRDEAIKGLKVLRKDFSGYKPNEEMFDMAIEALQTDIVRCKECKYRYVTGEATHLEGEVTGFYVCDFMDAQYEDDGYCHHGERSEDE